MIPIQKPFFGIQMVDAATGRGIPLVTLKTTSDVAYVTDSGGWVAFYEPDLMNRELWLSIFSHGYEKAADGFGFRGIRITPESGKTIQVKLERTQLAERLVRLTGEGIWRDSELLGIRKPGPRLPGGVMGQDSALAVPYKGKLYWFWGDTSRASYPLGNFHTSGATLPTSTDPEKALTYTYFTDPKSGFCRPMLFISRPGPVWVTGVTTIEDGKKLVAYFFRVNEKMEALERGLALWDDAKEGFNIVATFPVKEPSPISGHPFHHNGWLYGTREGSDPLPCVRVRPTLEALKDPAAYERLAVPPLELKDAKTGRKVQPHGGSVRYNAYRKRWVMIVLEKFGKASHIGELWYGEAPEMTGPWEKVVQIATHEKMDFYNPVHHSFFDKGKYLYLEGTYVNTFSGNPLTVPRYNYNQLLYRLDLDAATKALG